MALNDHHEVERWCLDREIGTFIFVIGEGSMGKAAVGIKLAEDERRELLSLARAQKTGQAMARRARIVLAAAGNYPPYPPPMAR
ncbi:MAG TPA: hypothetical protein VN715_06150 [Roseiarcus sp.]|nr:hypothetical protein [Roseiarcus sp.]